MVAAKIDFVVVEMNHIYIVVVAIAVGDVVDGVVVEEVQLLAD